METLNSNQSLLDRYNEFSANYEDTWKKLEGYSEISLKLIDEHCHANTRVLDAACGTGFFSRGLKTLKPVTGFDLSTKMIEVAQQKNKTGNYYVHNYYDPIPKELGLFDLIICLGALDFCEDVSRVLKNFSDALSPDGHLILNFIDRQGLPYKRLPISPERMKGVDLIFYTDEEIREELEKLNLHAKYPTRSLGYYNQYHELNINYLLYVINKQSHLH